MIDPKITLPLRDRVDAAGEPVHEFIVAGHNDDFALEVDGLTLVGRLDPERGPAQAIAVEAPLELVDGALKVTGVPENVQELLDRIVEAIAGEPEDGRTYGRKDREWQEAAPIVREHGGRTLDEPTLIVPQIVIGGGEVNNHLTRNAVLTEGVWRYAFDGPAFAVSASDGVMHFNTAANGEAGAEITWGAAVQIGLGGGVTTTGGRARRRDRQHSRRGHRRRHRYWPQRVERGKLGTAYVAWRRALVRLPLERQRFRQHQ